MTGSLQKRTVSATITTNVAVEPAIAFAVFTEEIGAWWLRGPRYRSSASSAPSTMKLETKLGGRLLEIFEDGREPFSFGKITVWEPPTRFAIEWRLSNFAPDEATDVDNNPYYATKHESERVVREEAKIPWRVYRPGIVVGSSETGEIDKIDGPYYFFRTIQRLRSLSPSWLRGIGIEGGPINIVPVDYVAKAMDHLAHQPGLDGQAFHLTDPEPMTVGQMANAFAKAAKAPQFGYNVDTAPLESSISSAAATSDTSVRKSTSVPSGLLRANSRVTATSSSTFSARASSCGSRLLRSTSR